MNASGSYGLELGGALRRAGCVRPLAPSDVEHVHALRRTRGAVIGEELSQPPHADEVLIPFGISTDDVLDYARWLDARGQRVRDALDAAYPAALGTPLVNGRPDPALPAPWRAVFSWWAAWSPRFRAFESSWAARVNGWDTVRAHHRALLEVAAEARAAGVPGVPSVGELGAVAPTPGDVLLEGLGSGASIAAQVGVLLLGAAAVVAVRRR